MIPQILCPRQKEVVRVTPQRKIGQIAHCRAALRAIDLPARRVTPQNPGNFDIDQMGCVKRLAGVEQTRLHSAAPLERNNTSINAEAPTTNHNRSRSARTASAGGTAESTEDRWLAIRRISSRR